MKQCVFTKCLQHKYPSILKQAKFNSMPQNDYFVIFRDLIITVLFFIFTGAATSFAQVATSDDRVCWHADWELRLEDFQGDTLVGDVEKMRKYGMEAAISISILCEMDIPATQSGRERNVEKTYFVPVLNRKTSVMLKGGESELDIQANLFHIAEIWARWARHQMVSAREKLEGFGGQSMYYIVVRDEMNRLRKEMSTAYLKDVIVQARPEALTEWTTMIMKMLEDSSEFGITDDDCRRVLSGVPADPDYIPAPLPQSEVFTEK